MASPPPFIPESAYSILHSHLSAPTLPPLKTGTSIDDVVLDGGIPRGCIIGISSPECIQSGARRIGLRFLLNGLLDKQNTKTGSIESRIMILDTTGHFTSDTSGLQDLVTVSNQLTASAALDRVDITRVFTIAGLYEVLADLLGLPYTSISSSELPTLKSKVASDIDLSKQPTRMLLITDLAPLVQNLFSTSERTAAHSQLAALTRTLATLSRRTRDSFTVVVLNGTTSTLSSAARGESEGVSVFADVDYRPALGPSFENLVDLSLLLSRRPRTKDDAEVVFVGGREEAVAMVDVVEVLRDEVLDIERWRGDNGDHESGCRSDKTGSREGRWGVIEE